MANVVWFQVQRPILAAYPCQLRAKRVSKPSSLLILGGTWVRKLFQLLLFAAA
jgi:hypothetical protein